MKFKWCLNIGLLTALCFAISSCSDKDNPDDGGFTPQTYNVQGKVEKGPFISGSTISIQLMDSKLEALGEFYSSTIQDDMGNFSFGSKSFKAPYAELTANGYFFNEVEGRLSSGTLNLRALVDLSDEATVNVNILTHLKYQRILNLVSEGKKLGDANQQAQKELFTAFGLQKYSDTDASQFSITEGTNESAALIAISSLLIVERSEAELTEYLAKLCREFGENGTFPTETKQQLKADREKLASRLSYIKDNIIDRYQELGKTVEVQELGLFFDWDDDGIAGNETLKEGEEVVLEKEVLEVPNEGGTYKIGFTSPIPVYLIPPVQGNPSNSITEESLYKNIYEDITSTDISLEKDIENSLLTVKIAPLKSRKSESVSVYLYDCLGNTVATLNVSQEGNNDTSLPKLGSIGKQLVENIAASIARGFSTLSLIEQYYYSNKTTNFVEQKISSISTDVNTVWSIFYMANGNNIKLKEAEAQQLGIYQDIFNVFSAMYYYNMVVFWGDVPYVYTYDPDIFNMYTSRTPQTEILNSLKENLISAIDYLEEKRNESLKNTNEYFFVSKDVARILLADIYMYQGDYVNAELQLSKVIENGFYDLDASNYSKKETIDNLWNNGSGKESIFITKDEISPQSNINRSVIVPLMNYTDVFLSYAECLYKSGNTAKAKTFLDKVVVAKSITVSDDVFTGIKDARMQLLLYSVGNFAFLKRNNIAKEEYGVPDYRLVLPIPRKEIDKNPKITQNPEYK